MNQTIAALKLQLALTTLTLEIVAAITDDEVVMQNVEEIAKINSELIRETTDGIDDQEIAEQFTDDPEEELPDDLRKEFDMIFDEIVRADNYDIE